MKILLLLSGNTYEKELYNALLKRGCAVEQFENRINTFFPFAENRTDDEIIREIALKVSETVPDVIFSFGYFPLVSVFCMSMRLKYVSWVYEFPCASLYSCTVLNDVNRIFISDSPEAEKLKSNGIDTVHYIRSACSISERKETDHEIVLTEKVPYSANALKMKALDGTKDSTKGYADGLIASQCFNYGINAIEGFIPAYVMEDFESVCPLYRQDGGVETGQYLYSEYMLMPEVTFEERSSMMMYSKDTMKLDTADEGFGKINLNLTSRNNHGGIPFSALKVMAAGGFLLTNYQADFMNEFRAGEEYDIFDEGWQIKDKIRYYLEHDRIRKDIAHAGYEHVKRYNTFDVVLDEIMKSIV